MLIYLVTNTINGKRYVGQTNQRLSSRWWSHVNRANCRALYSAIHKYGEKNFSVEVLCEVPTKELANEFEQEYIVRYFTLAPNGYNILSGGNERPLMGEKQKEGLRERMVGNKIRFGTSLTEEAKQKLRLSNLGKTLSQEHRRKISAAHKGLRPTQESRERMRKAKLGRTHSLETRLKMKQSQINRRARETHV